MKAIDGAESLLANIHFLNVPKQKGGRERGTKFNCFYVPRDHVKTSKHKPRENNSSLLPRMQKLRCYSHSSGDIKGG